MNIKNNKIYIFTIIFIISLPFTVQNLSLANSSEINKLLEQTENLRTQNYSQFSDNLSILNSHKSEFDQQQLCFFEYLQSYREIYIGDSDSTEKNLSQLLDRCEKLGIRIRIYATLAGHYYVARDYYNSIVNLNFVISNIDNTDDKKTKQIAYTIAFLVYKRLERNSLSLKYIDLLLNDNPADDLKCKALSTRYSIHLKTKQYSEFENKILDSISLCEKTNEFVFSNILKLYYLKNKLENSTTNNEISKIIDELNSADTQIEKTKYNNIIGLKNSLFAEAYLKANNIEKAIEYATLTIKGEDHSGRSNYKPSALKILMENAEQQGDFDKAFEYLKEINEIEQYINNDNQAQTIAYYSVTHENLANTHKIDFLNKQNEVLKLQNKLSEETKLNQQLIILSLILASAFFILWGYKHSRERKIFKNLSEMDPMTLIFNRKGLRDHMNYLLPYSEKKNEIIAYAIFDLDHFKKINDAFGHVIGDWVIENVIKVCKTVKGSNEKITFGRLGGEEFAIIIRDSNIQELQTFCENCRTAIEKLDTKATKNNFKITASFGLTTSELSSYTYTKLLTHADSALYQAKDNGRNQIQIYTPK